MKNECVSRGAQITFPTKTNILWCQEAIEDIEVL